MHEAVKTGLAERVAREYRARLLRVAHPGGRVAPVRELAAELGVSVTTILAAQAELAAQGFLEIRQGSGVYVTQKALNRPVGIYSNLDLFQPHVSVFQHLVMRELRLWFAARGMRAECYIGESGSVQNLEPQAESRFMQDVSAGRLAGVVLRSVPDSYAWQRWRQALPIPVVGGSADAAVRTDAGAMVREGVRLLREQGCRRIALLAWKTDDNMHALFRQALAEVGLPYHPAWVKGDLNPMLTGAGWEEFREIWSAEREKPDGLLVGDDILFADAGRAILEMRIPVPGRLRVVTHANVGAQTVYPFPVTLLEIDPARYAGLLAGLLWAKLRGESPKAPVTMRHEVRTVTAQTVGRAANVHAPATVATAGITPAGVVDRPCETAS